MTPKPVLTSAEELFDLVPGHPVVLLIVEDGQEHVQVVEDVRESPRRPQSNIQIRTRPPRSEPLVEGNPGCRDVVAKRIEQPPNEIGASSTRKHRKVDRQRDRAEGELRPLFAAAGHGRSEHLRQRDTHEGRGDVRPIVHVGFERPGLGRAMPPPHQPHRIDLEKHRDRAPLIRGLRKEDVRLPKPKSDGANRVRVLMQQESEVCGRLGRRGQL